MYIYVQLKIKKHIFIYHEYSFYNITVCNIIKSNRNNAERPVKYHT